MQTSKEIPGMFEGRILPLLIKLTLPVLGGMAFQLLYNVVDTIWISRIDLNDPSYVGGTGIIFPILVLAIAMGNGFLVGTSSLVARAIGEKAESLFNKVTESGIAVAVGTAAVFMTLFYLFDEQIVRLLGAEGDYFVHALEYFHYIIPATLVMFVGMVLLGIFQGEGQMDKVMKAMLISTIGNIILDPILIFLFDMGVSGAVLATTIAQFIAVLYCISLLIRKKSIIRLDWKLRNIRGSIAGQIVSIGFPQAVGQATTAVSFLILNRIVINIDRLALTAFTICGKFEQIVLWPFFAMGSALLTMAGQNAGRGNISRVRKIWNTSVLAALVFCLLLSTIMFLFARHIYPLFSDIPDVIEYAVTQTRVVIYSYVFAAIAVLAGFLFQSIGRPFPAFIVTMLRLFGLAVPVIYLCNYFFNWGMYGVWTGIIFGNTTGAAVALLWSRLTLKKLERGEIKVKRAGTADG